MSPAVEKLTAMITAEDRFNHCAADLRQLQAEALDERFQERKGTIKLLGKRAEDAGTAQVRAIEDVVPLLFPHTAYKSYPESFLSEGKWDRLTRWLGTISPYPITPMETADIDDIDVWIARLQANGHFVSCSSGTTGKSAMLIASERDMTWSEVDTVGVFSWGSGVEPKQDRMIVGTAATAAVPKNLRIGAAQYAAFANPAWPRWQYPVPPITVGALTGQVVMRKKIAAGTARPDEVAEFERKAAMRQAAVDAAIGLTVDHIVENRDKKLMLAGLWGGLYAVAAAVRERGFGGADFNPDNCLYVGGGMKRAQLPPDYQQFVHETFNIPAGRHFQNYSMQELNSGMPKCSDEGRYHVPPWIVPILLDKEGDHALPHEGDGEVTGRAAFFDLSLDGRWGGVITGDRITLTNEPCPSCGSAGASIRDDIARFADLEGDDKIGCAGTVDAYVRGQS
jgi:hypothetical protein